MCVFITAELEQLLNTEEKKHCFFFVEKNCVVGIGAEERGLRAEGIWEQFGGIVSERLARARAVLCRLSRTRAPGPRHG